MGHQQGRYQSVFVTKSPEKEKAESLFFDRAFGLFDMMNQVRREEESHRMQ